MSGDAPVALPLFAPDPAPARVPSAADPPTADRDDSRAATAGSSQALYRRYRSRDFNELVGQEPIVQTLRNALAAGRLAHAYLFCGPRGTGKTSTARLLAKAVNCQAPAEAERPCNVCEACRSINEGRAVDLIEIDAASNNSVEDVRDLRERVNFAPAQLRHKFYIIDEVHMMSISAFNALLKTLEEPPAHTIFVLATTDPQKLPATVLSRCQRFDFRRIALPVLVGHMQHIVAAEGYTVEPGVLELIGRQATGCMRDALSLLDQLMSFADGLVTLAQVQAVLGTRSTGEVARFVDQIIAGDTGSGLQLLHAAIDNGADLRQFNRQIVEHLRGLLLLRAGGDGAALDATEEEIALLRAQANRVALPALTAWIRAFTNADNGLKNTLYGALPLELALVEATLAGSAPAAEPAGRLATGARPESAARPAPVVAADRPASAPLPTRERPMPVPAPVVAADRPAPAPLPTRERPMPVPAPVRPSPPPPTVPAGAVDTPVAPTAGAPADLETVLSGWPRVRELVKSRGPSLPALLQPGQVVALEGSFIVLGFGPKSEFHRGKLEEPKNRDAVESVVAEVLGYPYRLRCQIMSEEDLARVRPAPHPSAGPENGDGTAATARVRKAQAIFNDD